MIPQRFGIRVKQDAGIQKQFDTISQLYASAEEIINCGDAGQEGELIQRWVMQKAGVKCPVKRLWISSMTDEAIREGVCGLAHAAAIRLTLCRRTLPSDLRLGARYERNPTLYLKIRAARQYAVEHRTCTNAYVGPDRAPASRNRKFQA